MTSNNIFTDIAAEVAKSDLSELYLIAGRGFGLTNASGEVHMIAAKAQQDMHEDAYVVLGAHFNMCDAVSKNVVFDDGCSGVIDCDGVAVEFQVRQIGNSPKTYRVLFSRVNAVKLMTDVIHKIQDISDRLQRLESAATR